MKVRDLMSVDVVTLDAGDPLVAAEEIMGFRRFRHLPVTEEGRLIGLVTHRDLLRACVSPFTEDSRKKDAILKARVNVRDIMHARVKTVGPETDLAEAAAMLRTGAFGCLPVVEADGRLLGIVTEADFVRLAEILLRRTQEKDPEFLGSLREELARR